jgi:isoamylase
VFPKESRSILTSVNNITYHDGFTLQDLVSYVDRHNEANGEQNRDGHGHNISANYGVEGASKNKQIIAMRERQKRNLFATLLLSQGIPHVLGGDELSRSQQGNNNAYCQDNEINWIDWTLNQQKQDFLEFCAYVIAMRRNSELLSHLLLKDDNYTLDSNVDRVFWYRPDGARKLEDDWHDHNNQAFAVELKGVSKEANKINEHWLLIFNASDHDVSFHLPKLNSTDGWQLLLDTRYGKLSEQPDVVATDAHMQDYRSICVFKRSACE